MGIPANAPFVYRFEPTPGRVYGPRPLEQVVAYYAGRDECECAPVDSSGQVCGLWRRVAEVAPELLPAPATKRQLARLSKLRVPHADGVSGNEARVLGREAEGQLTPTPGQRRKLDAAKLAMPDGATRGQVADLLDQHARAEAIQRLRRDGATITDDASWDIIQQVDDDLDEAVVAERMLAPLRRKGLAIPNRLALDEAYEWQSTWGDTKDAMAEARREIGLVIPFPRELSRTDLDALAAALSETVQAAGAWEASLEWLASRSDGIARIPTRWQRRAVMPELFGRIRIGTWQGSDEDNLSLARNALAATRPG